jgi:hypothetical protein
MIRILIIDDTNSPDFVEEMRRDVSGQFTNTDVQIVSINPVTILDVEGEGHQVALAKFLNQIKQLACEFWDVTIIDLNLADVKLPEPEKIQLPISIAESFRENNHAATVIIYSGTLSDHVQNLLNGRGDIPSEFALKKIFRAEIANFFPRRRIIPEVLSALDNPSWLLRVDRLLMKYAPMVVGPEEADFKGCTFSSLAALVRRQDHDGQKITQLTAEYGIACFADLNS